MSNLKKHFVFKVAGVGSNSPTVNGSPPSGELLLPSFSKSAFMNEVSCLLEQCGSYVSSMNEFCSSGCSLAKCLVKVFQAVPLYKDIASSLQNNWEEIAQTTAAASAAVKTETLMQLQDVLTRLEGFGENREEELSESVHAASACLMAYIELQAQFSYSVSKTLTKLSRQHNGCSKTSRAEDAVRKQCSQIINRLTGPSPAKVSSPPTPPPIPQSTPTSVWPAEIHLAPSGVELGPLSADRMVCEAVDSGLDDVINLLSIGSMPAVTKQIAQETSSSSSSCSTSSGPPKIPPRPDAISQDAFRMKQLELTRTKAEDGPTWSPFNQWGSDWGSEEFPNWPKCSATSEDSNWPKWSLTPSANALSSASASTKEKTFTWPRPLRDPSTPWEPYDDDPGPSDTSGRDGEKLSKTCTWPLKVADNAWMDSSGEQWKRHETTPQSPQPPWSPDGSSQGGGFRLFSQR